MSKQVMDIGTAIGVIITAMRIIIFALGIIIGLLTSILMAVKP